jgi:hypothetical protein
VTKITFIGAGSTVFAKNLMGDIWSYPELADATICLMDIDAKRLKQSEQVAHHIINTLGINPTVETTTDRREALTGADYVVCMIQVGGYEPATVIDFESLRNMVCVKLSQIHLALVALCGVYGQSLYYSTSQKIWKNSALMHSSSTM